MNAPRSSKALHRAAATLGAALLGLAGTLAAATPAHAEASVGYVRLAHLSPDTPKVDVYLSKVGDNPPAGPTPGRDYGNQLQEEPNEAFSRSAAQ